MALSQADSGHETLLSEDDSPTPTVERASSEVIYSAIGNVGSSSMGPSCNGGGSSFARSRRSLAEPMNGGNGGPIYEDIDQYHHQPPMITPVSGVPNLKGKCVIRPIAFRPTPSGSSTSINCSGMLSGSSTPTNMSFRPIMPSSGSSSITPISGLYGRTMQQQQQQYVGVSSEGFAPGHPLAKEGRRHYGSSQELHVAQAPPPVAFNKFNSLDRRTLARRHQHSNNLKLFPNNNSGAESLPPPPPPPLAAASSVYCGKEPERRHSSYDPHGRSATRYRPLANSADPSRCPPTNINNGNSGGSGGGGKVLSAMNINGLPDPYVLSRSNNANQIYSSQESLNSQRSSNNRSSAIATAVSARGPATTASNCGTPQFQNLSGTVRNTSRGSLNNLNNNNNNNNTSHYHSNVTVTMVSPNVPNMMRSVSGSSLQHMTENTAPPQQQHQSLHHHHHQHHPQQQQQQRILLGLQQQQQQHDSSSSSRSTSSGGSNGACSEMNQTPSPSDSAVGDLESMLKEKDTEINYLRETMEQNEQVIFKVYEEKEKMWERELRKIKGLYDNRLRASQLKSSKMEQALTNQTYQLQSDKCRLEQDLDEMRKEMENQKRENERLSQELRKSMEDTDRNSRGMKSGATDSSAASADQRVKELRMELERRDNRIRDLETNKSSLQSEVAELKSLLADKDCGGSSGEDYGLQKEIILARDRQVEKLQEEVEEAKGEAAETRALLEGSRLGFEKEKAHWLDEKEKVIRYQKQLQLNYVQMYKRNKTLESEIEQLGRTVDEQARVISERKEEAAAAAAAAAVGAKVKKSNSVRSKFFKMALHSESQC